MHCAPYADWRLKQGETTALKSWYTERDVMSTQEISPDPYWERFIETDKDGTRFFHVDCDLQYIRSGDLLIDYHESVLDGDDPEESILGYQRKQERIKQHIIANGLDPNLFGALMVNQRSGGVYAVGDGGTRLRAFREVTGSDGDEIYVLCLVFKWADQDEIQNYVTYNQERAGLTAVDLFVAKLKAGDPTATAIEKILVDETGFGISTRDWRCVAAIRLAHKHGNLGSVMRLMHTLSWTTMQSGRTQQIVGGIDLCAQRPPFDPKRAVERWRELNPLLVKRKSSDLKNLGDIGSGSRSIARYYAVVLGGEYDRRLQASKQLRMLERFTQHQDDDDE
jgi:hypothetical protein